MIILNDRYLNDKKWLEKKNERKQSLEEQFEELKSPKVVATALLRILAYYC